MSTPKPEKLVIKADADANNRNWLNRGPLLRRRVPEDMKRQTRKGKQDDHTQA